MTHSCSGTSRANGTGLRNRKDGDGDVVIPTVSEEEFGEDNKRLDHTSNRFKPRFYHPNIAENSKIKAWTKPYHSNK